MSVTQDYKTFTFTPKEAGSLAAAALILSVDIAGRAAMALAAGDGEKVNELLDMGEALTAAHTKLVRE